MRICINPIPLIISLSFAFILGTFSGLAGNLSSFIAVLLPILFAASLLHLCLSWKSFAFHQEFSTDHPQKGEAVHYRLEMANESFLPLSMGSCLFADPGLGTNFEREAGLPTDPKQTTRIETDIRCNYRGTYVIGISSFLFRDLLGIVEIVKTIDPRVFYVFPELINLDSRIERLAQTSGADKPGTNAREEDPTIFEYLSPLVPGKSARRIAWKRWAATGMPAIQVYGQARSSALTVVLDLWPGFGEGQEKLASEDIAMSACFSLLRHFSREGVLVELIYGGNDTGIEITTGEQFSRLFDQTTSVIFNDTRFPVSAFQPRRTTLLITTRPLIGHEKNRQIDLCAAYDDALKRGSVPHLLLCPPPGKVEEESLVMKRLANTKLSLGIRGLLSIVDSRKGLEDLANALMQ